MSIDDSIHPVNSISIDQMDRDYVVLTNIKIILVISMTFSIAILILSSVSDDSDLDDDQPALYDTSMSFWIQCFNVCINCTVAYYIGPTVVRLCNPDNTIIDGHRLAHRLANWVWAHITLLLKKSYWLPIKQRIDYKLCLLTYWNTSNSTIYNTYLCKFAIVSLFHFTFCLQSLQDINMKYLLKSSEKITRCLCGPVPWTLLPHGPIFLLLHQLWLSVQVPYMNIISARSDRSSSACFNSEFPSRFCKRYFRTSRSSCCYIDSECPCNC